MNQKCWIMWSGVQSVFYWLFIYPGTQLWSTLRHMLFLFYWESPEVSVVQASDRSRYKMSPNSGCSVRKEWKFSSLRVAHMLPVRDVPVRSCFNDLLPLLLALPVTLDLISPPHTSALLCGCEEAATRMCGIVTMASVESTFIYFLIFWLNYFCTLVQQMKRNDNTCGHRESNL